MLVERIADAAGDERHADHAHARQTARLAPPYDAGLASDKNWDLDAIAPAGGVRSTADDMLKLLAAAMATTTIGRP